MIKSGLKTYLNNDIVHSSPSKQRKKAKAVIQEVKQREGKMMPIPKEIEESKRKYGWYLMNVKVSGGRKGIQKAMQIISDFNAILKKAHLQQIKRFLGIK